MAGCDPGFIDVDETWNQTTALRKYLSHKSWYSKCIVKVQNLKDRSDKAYDSRVEENIYLNLTKAENTASCLGQIANNLTQIKYGKWEDHTKEVQNMDAEVAALWIDMTTKAHVRGQAAARRNTALPAAPQEPENSGGMKLVLKDLNVKSYDRRVEENIYANLTKAENKTACLWQIFLYLTQIKYKKWEDHTKEVQDMDAEVAALWKEISIKAHVRGQAAVWRNVAPHASACASLVKIGLVAEYKRQRWWRICQSF